MIIDDTVVTPRAGPGGRSGGHDRPAPREGGADRRSARSCRSGSAGCSRSARWGDAVLVARDGARPARRSACCRGRSTRRSTSTASAARRRCRRRSSRPSCSRSRSGSRSSTSEQILARLSGVSFERRGELVIVDVLEADGTWDQRKSMLMETQLGAVGQLLDDPGRAVDGRSHRARERLPAAKVPAPPAATAPAAAEPAAKPEPPSPRPHRPSRSRRARRSPSRRSTARSCSCSRPSASTSTSPPRSASATGTASSAAPTTCPGAMRDRMHRDGASWIAPLEFLSEVFVDGKPLTKPQFEKDAAAAVPTARSSRSRSTSRGSARSCCSRFPARAGSSPR